MGNHGRSKGWKIEEKERVGRSRIPRKPVLGCIQAVVGKKKFRVRFEDGSLEEIKERGMDVLKDQSGAERDPDLYPNKCLSIAKD